MQLIELYEQRFVECGLSTCHAIDGVWVGYVNSSTLTLIGFMQLPLDWHPATECNWKNCVCKYCWVSRWVLIVPCHAIDGVWVGWVDTDRVHAVAARLAALTSMCVWVHNESDGWCFLIEGHVMWDMFEESCCTLYLAWPTLDRHENLCITTMINKRWTKPDSAGFRKFNPFRYVKEQNKITRDLIRQCGSKPEWNINRWRVNAIGTV